MNFLAHVYLSGNNDDIIIGNLIADALRGKQIEKYEGGILMGIFLHRKIDSYTDAHDIFHQSRDLIIHKYHKYSGVLIDMFYDHFLAKNWQDYSPVPIKEVTKHAYSLLLDNFKILPKKTKRILPYMAGNDWLANYAYLGNMEKYLKGMSRRANFDSHMDEAILDLKMNYYALEKDFKKFFPDIITYTKQQIEEIKQDMGLNDYQPSVL